VKKKEAAPTERRERGALSGPSPVFFSGTYLLLYETLSLHQLHIFADFRLSLSIFIYEGLLNVRLIRHALCVVKGTIIAKR
jgi:hypothetical protein